jgi:hypothetical protein
MDRVPEGSRPFSNGGSRLVWSCRSYAACSSATDPTLTLDYLPVTTLDAPEAMVVSSQARSQPPGVRAPRGPVGSPSPSRGRTPAGPNAQNPSSPSAALDTDQRLISAIRRVTPSWYGVVCVVRMSSTPRSSFIQRAARARDPHRRAARPARAAASGTPPGPDPLSPGPVPGTASRLPRRRPPSGPGSARRSPSRGGGGSATNAHSRHVAAAGDVSRAG